MSTLLIYLPFIISFLIGYLLLGIMLPKEKKLPTSLQLFLAGGLGLGISAHITFYSFVIFDRLNTPFVIAINVFALLYLLTLALIKQKIKVHPLSFLDFSKWRSFIAT